MSADLTREQLRELFLFEALTDERLDALVQLGDVVEVPAGNAVFREGEPAARLVVLLSGTISMTRLVRGDELEITRSDHVGAYGGATQAYVKPEEDKLYSASWTAVTDCRVYALPGTNFAALVREWFPMAVHLLEGLFLGLMASNELIGQRERLQALGSLTAGPGRCGWTAGGVGRCDLGRPGRVLAPGRRKRGSGGRSPGAAHGRPGRGRRGRGVRARCRDNGAVAAAVDRAVRDGRGSRTRGASRTRRSATGSSSCDLPGRLQERHGP